MTPIEAPAFAKDQWNAWGVVGVFAGALILAILAELTFWVLLLRLDPIFRSYGNIRSVLDASKHDPALLARIDTPAFHLFAALAFLAGVAIGIALLRSWIGRATARDLGFIRPRASQLGEGVAVGLALLVASAIVNAIVVLLFHHHPSSAKLLYEDRSPIAVLMAAFVGVLLAPLSEELLCRGLLFAGLVQRMAPPWAALISGAAFSALHLDPWGFVIRLGVGYALALLYFKSKTIWVPVTAHATINAIAFLATLRAPHQP